MYNSGPIEAFRSAWGIYSNASKIAKMVSSVAVPALVICRDKIYYSAFRIDYIDREPKMEISVNAAESSDLYILKELIVIITIF